MADLVHDLIFARNQAERRDCWVVVVVPDGQVAEALQVMGAVVPADTFSGRTAVFPKGRLSLAGGSSPVFPTAPFEVMFLGWGEGRVQAGMEPWRKAAAGEIRWAP